MDEERLVFLGKLVLALQKLWFVRQLKGRTEAIVLCGFFYLKWLNLRNQYIFLGEVDPGLGWPFKTL